MRGREPRVCEGIDRRHDRYRALHREALDVTRTVLAGIRADQWSLATPDEGWDVRALVNHIVSGKLTTGRAIAEVGDRLDGDVLGADPVAAYDESATAAAAAFEVPGALDMPCAASYGPVRGRYMRVTGLSTC